MPLPLSLLMLLLALSLLWFGKRRAASFLIAFNVIFLYLASISPISDRIAGSLEFQHPKYAGQGVQNVVVLGGYHASDERVPLIGLLSRTSLARLMQGISVYKQNPGSKLLLSGYAGNDALSHAQAMATVAQYLGINPLDILLAPQAKDTLEEAHAWHSRLQGQQFALVTSAVHMPRAMYLFQTQGLNPIAAPANYETAGAKSTYWRDWLPKAHALELTSAAWHEMLGLTWARLNTFLNGGVADGL